jgi:hypothetical protein
VRARLDRAASQQRSHAQAGTLGEDGGQPPGLLQRDVVGDQDQGRQWIIGVLAAVASEVGDILGLQQPGAVDQLGLHDVEGAGQAGRPPQPGEADGVGDQAGADQQHLDGRWATSRQERDQRGAGQPVGAWPQDPDGAVAGQIQGDLVAGALPNGHPGGGGVAGIPRCRGDPRPWWRVARRAALRAAVPQLVERCCDLAPRRGVVICHTVVYELATPALRHAGVTVLHDQPLPFPLGNWRAAFVAGLRTALA